MKLGTHMPGGERRKLIDIEDPRTKVKVTSKNRERKMNVIRASTFSFPHNILRMKYLI